MHGRVVSVPQERRPPAGALSRPNPQSDEEVPVRSSLNRSSRPARFLPVLIAFGLVLAGIPAGAQAPPKYHDHAGLTKALQALAGAAGPAARLESIGKTRSGRDLWVLEIANPGGVPAGQASGPAHRRGLRRRLSRRRRDRPGRRRVPGEERGFRPRGQEPARRLHGLHHAARQPRRGRGLLRPPQDGPADQRQPLRRRQRRPRRRGRPRRPQRRRLHHGHAGQGGGRRVRDRPR